MHLIVSKANLICDMEFMAMKKYVGIEQVVGQNCLVKEYQQLRMWMEE